MSCFRSYYHYRSCSSSYSLYSSCLVPNSLTTAPAPPAPAKPYEQDRPHHSHRIFPRYHGWVWPLLTCQPGSRSKIRRVSSKMSRRSRRRLSSRSKIRRSSSMMSKRRPWSDLPGQLSLERSWCPWWSSSARLSPAARGSRNQDAGEEAGDSRGSRKLERKLERK